MQKMIKNKKENTNKNKKQKMNKNKIKKTNSFEQTEIVPTTGISGLATKIAKQKRQKKHKP